MKTTNKNNATVYFSTTFTLRNYITTGLLVLYVIRYFIKNIQFARIQLFIFLSFLCTSLLS